MTPLEKVLKSCREAGLQAPDRSYLIKKYGLEEVERNLGKNDNEQLVFDNVVCKDAISEPKTKPENIGKSKDNNTKTSDKAIYSTQDNQPANDHDKKELREKVQSVLLALLPFIFFGSALLGSYRSFTLCFSFFSRYNPIDGALTMAGLLVAVAFATPQAFPLLWHQVKQGKRIFLFCLVILLAGASIGTNVLITGQELINQKSDSTTIEQDNNAKAYQSKQQIEDLVTQKKELSESLAIDKEERSILLEAQKSLVVGSVDYNRTRNNIEAIKGRIDRTIESMRLVDKSISKQRNIVAIASQSSQNNGQLEYVVNWFSSFIIEVGGPVCLSLSLFL